LISVGQATAFSTSPLTTIRSPPGAFGNVQGIVRRLENSIGIISVGRKFGHT